MRLFGYISTSRDRKVAEKFAYSNKEAGLKKVLFVIHWFDHTCHYFMNTGAYNHEEEILLYDGTIFQVVSVQDEDYEEFTLQNVHTMDGFGPEYNGVKAIKVFEDEDGDSKVKLLEGD